MPEAPDFGWISLLPPLVAIGLAIWTRHVFVSLFAGVWIGATILAGWNPVTGLVGSVRDFIVPSVGDPSNAGVLVLLVCISGFVALLQKSGAMTAFAHLAGKYVTNPLRAHVAVWISGIVIFFSDTANTLILGPVYTPIFDRLRISREKLSYLIDSTASPVSVLVPTTSWGAYIFGLILVQYQLLGIGQDGARGVEQAAMAALISAIPFQYYALGSLALILILAFLKTDFGPMRKAERRVAETGELFSEGAKPMRIEVPQEVPENAPAKAMTMVWGLVGLFAATGAMLLFTGGYWAPVAPGGEAVSIGDALSNAAGALSVTMGFIAGSLVIGARMMAQATKGKVVIDEWIKGGGAVFSVLMILVFAWSLGAVCNNDNLNTGAYVSGIAQDTIDKTFIPAVIFLIGAVISFSTGTSWGSYAILMPIAIPLANDIGIPQAIAIGAVLSGGLFGDHCSPISDTTILSSIGAASDLMDHVRTQLPYALVAALAAAVAYVVAMKTEGALGLVVCLAILVAAVVLFRALGNRRSAGPA